MKVNDWYMKKLGVTENEPEEHAPQTSNDPRERSRELDEGEETVADASGEPEEERPKKPRYGRSKGKLCARGNERTHKDAPMSRDIRDQGFERHQIGRVVSIGRMTPHLADTLDRKSDQYKVARAWLVEEILRYAVGLKSHAPYATNIIEKLPGIARLIDKNTD